MSLKEKELSTRVGNTDQTLPGISGRYSLLLFERRISMRREDKKRIRTSKNKA